MEDKEQASLRKNKLKPHPKSQANFLSHYLFCWEVPVIVKGWRKELNEDDLYAPLKEYESTKLGDALEQAWQGEENFAKNPSLWRCLLKVFGSQYIFGGLIFYPFEIANALLQPFFLSKILDFYTPNQTTVTLTQAYQYSAGLSVLFCIRVFCFNMFLFTNTVTGMKARIACSSLIYRKCLEMKKKNLKEFTMGQLINILSNDLSRFDQMASYLHFIPLGVLQFILGTYYMDVSLNHAALAGGAIIVLCLLFQLFVSVKISKARFKVAAKTDYRIRLMNDIICGIEAVKMYTWEKSFAKVVEAARKLELDRIATASHYRLFNNTFKIYMGKFCVFLSILVAVLTNYHLKSQYVYILINIFEMFKFYVVVFLPMAVVMLAESCVSVRRIEEFLLHNSTKSKKLVKTKKNKNLELENCVLKAHEELSKRSSFVNLENITAKWDKDLSNVLDNVSFKASPGELVGVMGRAGSGKSTLLHIILQELEVLKGKVEVSGLISYASQEAWIFSASIKQNIIFGEKFDLDRYTKVVKVCALERDLTLFPNGDQTLVGDRGVLLSGGQKARVNLARAVYRNADIYLLDDPLSAVDAHVARHIFDDCIMDFLAQKCVILVTHQIHYFQKANRIYHLETGKVSKVGNYEQVIGLKDHLFDNTLSEAPTNTALETHSLQEEVKELRSAGTTNKKIYKGYCLAAGHWSFTVLMLSAYVVGQIFISLLDFFLSFWTNIEQGAITLSQTWSSILTTEHCLYIYIALTILAVLFNHLAAFVFTIFTMKVSKNLHNNMLYKIVHSTMDFFNHNPSGRLLNRFSKDLGCVDELLPLHLMNLITVITTYVAIFVIIIALNYYMIVPSILLTSLAIFFSYMFQPTNRNIKRTEGITKSEVFTHMTASMQGLATIRAHKTQSTLIKEFDNYQDLHSSSYYLFIATFHAFGFWADFVSAVYTVLVVFSFFLLKGVGVANVGFAITQSINLLGMVQYGVKTWGELDSEMTSVERIVDYVELTPELDEGKFEPDECWPIKGDVSFQDVVLRYSDAPPVLKNVSFEVKSGEKVGIIGRTGAGKTSLISVLFRLFNFEGGVVIDGVDTKSLPLNKLRSKISIIPQEPILFLGSLRRNIDPFDEFTDDQLWKVLEELELKSMISDLPSGLDSTVRERGSNFSVGQRQLLCLVRAMLRNNKIIVLDEATANVDLKTDELIQNVIRKQFKECTVLTIAHRLNTVIDSDKILAMDGGRVVEFDHPYYLLQKTDGFFSGFAKKNGDKMMKNFIQIAKQALEEKLKK